MTGNCEERTINQVQLTTNTVGGSSPLQQKETL
jgi:hypothetical protein